MTDYTELVKALRGFDMGGSCPCDYSNLCENFECIVDQAAAAIEALQKTLKAVQENSGINFRMWQEAQAEVERLQAQLPKRGEWIKRHEFVEDTRFDGFRCSICNWWKGDFETYNYCPKCGAKMEVQNER